MFDSGRRATGVFLVVIAQETPFGRSGSGRVAFIAGRRVGGAVVRNGSKRVLREVCVRSGGPWPGYDVAVVARRDLRGSRAADVAEELARAIDRLEVVTR